MAGKFGFICLLLGLTLASAARLELTASARASAWMKAHQADPQDDSDLAALAKADPNSYAIVKALLAKQKMGLLNTRHPSEVATSPSNDAASDSSAPVLDAAGEPMMAAAPQPVDSGSHNWLSWKPADDSAVVSGVLGQVAALRGSQSLVSSQAKVQSTAEQVTQADTGMDLSFGAYQSAAKQETKSTFDAHASVAQAGLAKMEAEAATDDSSADTGMGRLLNVFGSGSAPAKSQEDDTPAGRLSAAGGAGPMGVTMDWDQEGNTPAAQKMMAAAPAAPAAAAASTNSYLSAYPLSMRQQNSPDEETPERRLNPAAILGAWLQKGKQSASPSSSDSYQAPEANPYAAMLH